MIVFLWILKNFSKLCLFFSSKIIASLMFLSILHLSLHIFLWYDVKSQLRKWRHLLNFCNWTELNVWSAIVCIIDCMKSWGGRVCLNWKKKEKFLTKSFPFSTWEKNIKIILNFKLNISKNKSRFPFFSVSDYLVSMPLGNLAFA